MLITLSLPNIVHNLFNYANTMQPGEKFTRNDMAMDLKNQTLTIISGKNCAQRFII